MFTLKPINTDEIMIYMQKNVSEKKDRLWQARCSPRVYQWLEDKMKSLRLAKADAILTASYAYLMLPENQRIALNSEFDKFCDSLEENASFPKPGSQRLSDDDIEDVLDEAGIEDRSPVKNENGK